MKTTLVLLYILFSILALWHSNRVAKPSSLMTFFIGIGLVLFATFRPDNMPDYQNYVNAYLVGSERFEPGFSLLSNITNFIYPSYLMLFFLFAVIAVGIKLYAIKKHSDFFWISMAIYISNVFILHDMIQIRVAVSSGILLASINLLHDKKRFKYIIACLVAILFHYSAAIMLILLFLNPHRINRGVYIALIPLSYITVLLGFDLGSLVDHITIAPIKERIDAYSAAMEHDIGSEINIFNALQLLRCALCVFLLFNINKIKSHNKYAILAVKIYTIALISIPLFSSFPVMSFRINELFLVIELILVPMIIYIFTYKRLSTLLPLSFGLLILLLNLYYIELIN